MKRREMIKDKEKFNFIIRHGKFNKNKSFVIYYIDNEESRFPHFGIAIKNSIGHAVVRNRLKRQTRSIIDNNKNLFKKNRDYIIMIRNECLNCKYEEMNTYLIDILKGIK